MQCREKASAHHVVMHATYVQINTNAFERFRRTEVRFLVVSTEVDQERRVGLLYQRIPVRIHIQPENTSYQIRILKLRLWSTKLINCLSIR